MSLDENTITFGKYKDLTVEILMRDRKYCKWLLSQEWFEKQYEYLFNKLKSYNPSKIFVEEKENKGDKNIFSYKFFNLVEPKNLENLSENDKKCYEFYYELVENIKGQIRENLSEPNPYDIKAPNGWLQKFEKKYSISRDIFKEFIFSHDLPNITDIIEYVKNFGGITYNGAKSFIIGKKNSLEQENCWEKILKEKYGEDIGTQYKYKKCIFDFIHIKKGILYECKLGLKDFNEKQYKKYLTTLESFAIIYLIGKDTIIDMKNRKIYCLSKEKFTCELIDRLGNKNRTKFDTLISSFEIIESNNFLDYI